MEGETLPNETEPSVDTTPQESPERTGLFYKSAEPAEEPQESETAESDPTTQDEAKTPPVSADEPSATPTAESEPSGEESDPIQASGEEEETGETIQSFSQLVEHMEWDPEWAQTLTLTKKVDGEEKEVTIGELLKVDQTLDAAVKRLDEAKVKSKEMLEEADTGRQTQAKKLAETAAVLSFLDEFLGLKNADQRLAQIRKDQGDTAYLAEKDRMTTLQQKLAQVRQYASTAMEEVMGHMGGGMTEAEKEELAKEEHSALLNRIPAWQKDADLMERESREMVGYIRDTYGYDDEAIQNTLDHRLWDMARKAMLYDRGQEAAKATEKVVRKIPTMKPSANNPKKDDKPRDRLTTFYGNSGRK